MKILQAVAALFLVGAPVVAGDWPQFRGPNGGGVSDEKGIPTSWSETENVRWKANIPGRSVSSPIVYQGRVYVLSCSGVRADRLHVICLDSKDGKQLWQRELLATGNTGCHPKSSMAAPTPCAGPEGIFVLFATADLAAFDPDGNLKWYRSLTTDYPAIANQVGMASSPVLAGGTLIVPMDTAGDSFVAGLDPKTGKNIWKVDRPKEINWVTPTVRNAGKTTEVLFPARTGLVAYDAATGKQRWTFAGGTGGIPSVITSGDLVFTPGGGLTCLQVNPEGTVVKELWKVQKLGSSSATPVLYNDRLYTVNPAGTLVCADPKTGKDLWQERLKRGKYWASPVAVDGKIYAFSDEGWCSIFEAGSEAANVINHVQMPKMEIMGTPAISDGALFIQTVDQIYCIASKK